jgi:hypothetical protein
MLFTSQKYQKLLKVKLSVIHDNLSDNSFITTAQEQSEWKENLNTLMSTDLTKRKFSDSFTLHISNEYWNKNWAINHYDNNIIILLNFQFN